MKYGVRFCGGCNPRYERGEALKTIRKHFEGRVELEIAQEGVPYDGILSIGGCTNCCADYSMFENNGPCLKMWDQSHVQQIIEEIEKEVS